MVAKSRLEDTDVLVQFVISVCMFEVFFVNVCFMFCYHDCYLSVVLPCSCILTFNSIQVYIYMKM